ncbi:hypothetical protein BJ138DRAFT_1148622 [Hygrophoropsis aurantiaca]|uniref:Uncharacterized protein n=1 Tax=Hygrophoropsis aurantiaca TaxID=72124 RepID=A0ACB8AH74_9AGAM|nr:hypothetical protein BJ138DRAFT_1148622 [Hygrophoropsis aurantiaca]
MGHSTRLELERTRRCFINATYSTKYTTTRIIGTYRSLLTNGHEFAYIRISRFSTLDGALDDTQTYSPIARYHSPYEISGTVSPSSHWLPSSITNTTKLQHYTTPPNALPRTTRMFDLQASLYRISEEKTSDWLTDSLLHSTLRHHSQEVPSVLELARQLGLPL